LDSVLSSILRNLSLLRMNPAHHQPTPNTSKKKIPCTWMGAVVGGA